MVSYLQFFGFVSGVLVIICFGSECEVSEWRQWEDCLGNCNFAMRVRNRDVSKPPFPEIQTSGRLALEQCPPLYQVQQCVTDFCLGNDTTLYNGTNEEKSKTGNDIDKNTVERSQTVDGLSKQPELQGKILYTASENDLIQKSDVTQDSSKLLTTTETTSTVLQTRPSSTSSTVEPVSVKGVQIAEHQMGPLNSLPVIKTEQVDLKTAETLDINNVKLPNPGNFILFAGLADTQRPQTSAETSVETFPSTTPLSQFSSTTTQLSQSSTVNNSHQSQVNISDMPIPDPFPLGTVKVLEQFPVESNVINNTVRIVQDKEVTTSKSNTVVAQGNSELVDEEEEESTKQISPSDKPTPNSNSSSTHTVSTIASTNYTSATVPTGNTQTANSTTATTSINVNINTTTTVSPAATTTSSPTASSAAIPIIVLGGKGPDTTSTSALPSSSSSTTTSTSTIAGERPVEPLVSSPGNTFVLGIPGGEKPPMRLHQIFVNREFQQTTTETNKPTQTPQPTDLGTRLPTVLPIETNKLTSVDRPASFPIPFNAVRQQEIDTQPVTPPIAIIRAPCTASSGNKRCCKQTHRNKCPDGKPAQMVLRWFRFSNQTECGAYNYGYCGYEIESQDNPIKFEEECYDLCYTDDERQKMPLFKNLRFHNGFRLLGMPETHTEKQNT